MMWTGILLCVLVLAATPKGSLGLSCYNCIHVEMESDNRDIDRMLESSLAQLNDRDCKYAYSGMASLSCESFNDGLWGAYQDDPFFEEYYDDIGQTQMVCHKERASIHYTYLGAKFTVHVVLRGCKGVDASHSLGCTSDLDNYDRSFTHMLRKEVFGTSGLNDDVDGTVCYCDTDNCNSASIPTLSVCVNFLSLLATLMVLCNRG